MFDQGLPGIRPEQIVSAAGDHHRVQYHRRAGHGGQGPGQNVDQFRARDHTDFNAVNSHVIEKTGNLVMDDLRLDFLDGIHLPGVLNRDRRNGADAVHSQGLKGFQIGLDAGPSGTVGSGDGQGHIDWVGFRTHGFP